MNINTLIHFRDWYTYIYSVFVSDSLREAYKMNKQDYYKSEIFTILASFLSSAQVGKKVTQQIQSSVCINSKFLKR